MPGEHQNHQFCHHGHSKNFNPHCPRHSTTCAAQEYGRPSVHTSQQQGRDTKRQKTQQAITLFRFVLSCFLASPFCVFCRLLLPVCRAAVRGLASSPSPELKVVRPGVSTDGQNGRPDVSVCRPRLKHCGYTCIQHAVLLSFCWVLGRTGPRV